jgi:hypothetical protein
MDILDTILSGPILFGLVVTISFGLVAKAIMGALGQMPILKAQLDTIKRGVSEAADGVTATRDRIGVLQEELKPLKQRARR